MDATHESGLVEVARARRIQTPSRREVLTALVTSGSFLVAASALALLADSAHDIALPTAAALVLAFAVLARCELEIGSGSAVPIQLVFVPMLFLLPLPLVPVCVCLGYLLGALYDAVTGRIQIGRTLALVGCSWFSLPPALILLAAGEPAPSWELWPLFVAAFAAQCGTDFVHFAVQQRLAYGHSPRVVLSPLARTAAFDALLSPVAFLAARDADFAFLALAPLLVVFAVLINERRRRLDALLEAERAERLARTDPLTGIANRRAFEERLAQEFERAQGRERAELTICLFDIDHFKAYNDTHGHPAGDRLLQDLARTWEQMVRPGDLLARLGGEEFALILQRCSLDDASPVVERLRRATPHGQTCSAGIAELEHGEDSESLVLRADVALYEAKQGGRARLARARPLVAA
jgi:diguanylate cyclase (GGDEF)-like protein